MTERTRVQKRLRLSLKRDELVTVLYALEQVIEDYKYDGGLVLAEKEQELLEKLKNKLHEYDGVPRRSGTSYVEAVRSR